MSFVPATRLLWLVFAAALVATAAGPWGELEPLWLLALQGWIFLSFLIYHTLPRS